MGRTLKGLGVLAFGAFVLWCCAKEPTRPRWDNAYDPGNGGGRVGRGVTGELFPGSLSHQDPTLVTLSLAMEPERGGTGFDRIVLRLPGPLDTLIDSVRVSRVARIADADTLPYLEGAPGSGGFRILRDADARGPYLQLDFDPEFPASPPAGARLDIGLRFPAAPAQATAGDTVVVSVQHREVPANLVPPLSVSAGQVNDNPFDAGSLSLSVLPSEWQNVQVQQLTQPVIYDNGCQELVVCLRVNNQTLETVLLDARPLEAGWVELQRNGAEWCGTLSAQDVVDADEVFRLDVVVGGSDGLFWKLLPRAEVITIRNSVPIADLTSDFAPARDWILHNTADTVLTFRLACPENSSGIVVDSLAGGLVDGAQFMTTSEISRIFLVLPDGNQVEGQLGQGFRFNLRSLPGGGVEVAPCTAETLGIVCRLDAFRRKGSRLALTLRPADVRAWNRQKPAERARVNGQAVQGPVFREVSWTASTAKLPLDDSQVVPRERGAAVFRGRLATGEFEGARIDSVFVQVHEGRAKLGDSVSVYVGSRTVGATDTLGLRRKGGVMVPTRDWRIDAEKQDEFEVRFDIGDRGLTLGDRLRFSAPSLRGVGLTSGYADTLVGSVETQTVTATWGGIGAEEVTPTLPDTTLIPRGGGVPLLRFDLVETTGQEDVVLDSLQFGFQASPGYSPDEILARVSLWDGQTLMGRATLAATGATIALPGGVRVPASGSRRLTLYADSVKAKAPRGVSLTTQLTEHGLYGRGGVSGRAAQRSSSSVPGPSAVVRIGEVRVPSVQPGVDGVEAPGTRDVELLRVDVQSLYEEAVLDSLHLRLEKPESWRTIDSLVVQSGDGGPLLGWAVPDSETVSSGILTVRLEDAIAPVAGTQGLVIRADLKPDSLPGLAIRVQSLLFHATGFISREELEDLDCIECRGRMLTLALGRGAVSGEPLTGTLPPGGNNVTILRVNLRETTGAEDLQLDGVKLRLSAGGTAALSGPLVLFAGTRVGALRRVLDGDEQPIGSWTFGPLGEAPGAQCPAGDTLWLEIRADLESRSCGRFDATLPVTGLRFHGVDSRTRFHASGTDPQSSRTVTCGAAEASLATTPDQSGGVRPGEWGTIGTVELTETSGNEGLRLARIWFLEAAQTPPSVHWRLQVGAYDYPSQAAGGDTVAFQPSDVTVAPGDSVLLALQAETDSGTVCPSPRASLSALGFRLIRATSEGEAPVSLVPGPSLVLAEGPPVFPAPVLDTLGAARVDAHEFRTTWQIHGPRFLESLLLKLEWFLERRVIGDLSAEVRPASLQGAAVFTWQPSADSVAVRIEKIRICGPARGVVEQFEGDSTVVGLKKGK